MSPILARSKVQEGLDPSTGFPLAGGETDEAGTGPPGNPPTAVRTFAPPGAQRSTHDHHIAAGTKFVDRPADPRRDLKCAITASPTRSLAANERYETLLSVIDAAIAEGSPEDRLQSDLDTLVAAFAFSRR